MSGFNLQKQKPIRLKKLRDSARDAPCMLELPGVCNGNPATTVLAHRHRGGMGQKCDDQDSLWMCSACHDVYDQRTPSEFTRDQLTKIFDELWPDQVRAWIRGGYLK